MFDLLEIAEGDMGYLASTPLFKTDSERYAFLAENQYLFRMTEVQLPAPGSTGWLHYDCYRVD